MKKHLGKRINSATPTMTVLRWCSCATACNREDIDMSRFINLLTRP